MRFGPTSKFRNFLSSHPPLITFIFCIGMMVVAFVSFAYYIKENKIIDPSVARDWNTVLYNATEINFCSSAGNLSEFPNKGAMLTNGNNYENISVHIRIFSLRPFSKSKDSVSSAKSAINGSLLGYSGELGNKSVYLHFAFQEGVALSCNNEHGCSQFVDSCLVISAPPNMLPATPQPEHCSFTKNDSSASLKMFGQVSKEENAPAKCSQVSIAIHHSKDERLFVYLTEATKSRIHVHLVHSSYFMILVILLVLTFGFFRGGHQHQHHESKESHNSYNPLVSSEL